MMNLVNTDRGGNMTEKRRKGLALVGVNKHARDYAVVVVEEGLAVGQVRPAPDEA